PISQPPRLSALGDVPHLAPCKLRAFRTHHYAEVTSALVAAPNLGSNHIYIEGLLRNQDHIRPTRYPAVDCYPARVPPHDLNHHYTVVGLGGGVNAINSLGYDVHCSVKTEREIRTGEIVINRLRNTDDSYTFIKTFGCD